MKIFAKIVLLASMGFLHFRRADGMDPAGEMNPDNFPERTIIIRMDDACIFDGPVGNADSAPLWLLPFQPHPINIFQFYIRMPKNKQYSGHFQEPGCNLRGLGPHNHLHHIPDSVSMRIEGDEYYVASPFEVHEQNWTIPYHYIYVAVPRGRTHKALLRSQDFKKDAKRYTSIYSGPPPNTKPESTPDHDDYLHMMRHLH